MPKDYSEYEEFYYFSQKQKLQNIKSLYEAINIIGFYSNEKIYTLLMPNLKHRRESKNEGFEEYLNWHKIYSQNSYKTKLYDFWKFLEKKNLWQPQVKGEKLIQGYLTNAKEKASVRVRLNGTQAYLSVKGLRGADLISRLEYEYPIPPSDAQEMLENFAGQVIEKIRYTQTLQGCIWEVDEFLGANAGLLVAEIELQAPDQEFYRPEWLGAEVSSDYRYLNSYLAEHPYTSW